MGDLRNTLSRLVHRMHEQIILLHNNHIISSFETYTVGVKGYKDYIEKKIYINVCML
jgi:hypothetical protein